MKHALVALCALSISSLPSNAGFADDTLEGETTIMVTDAWARKTRRTMSAAVYLTLQNISGETDTLLDVETQQAEMATLHQSSVQDGIMRMQEQDAITLNPGATLVFEPGGYHVMLMQLASPLNEGETFPITLSFEKTGDLVVDVTVTGIAGLQ